MRVILTGIAVAGLLSGVAFAAMIGAVAVLVLIGVGVVLLSRRPVDAYHWFEHALLVSILCAQVCLFWLTELSATAVLAVDLVLIGAVRFLIRQANGREIERALRAAGTRGAETLWSGS